MTSVETHNEILVAADTAARAADWAALWELRDGLRETDLWVGFYGPACAIAGWHVDREAGRAVLDEVVEAGFHQPELMSDEFAGSFGTEPGWQELADRMTANVPPPSLVLTDWPDFAPTIGPTLDRLAPEREQQLRERLPAPGQTAWETAVETLDWVTTRWEHANGHVDDRDAVEVLRRVDAGERFACVEYSIVLSQALNALSIPSRSLNLFMRDYHVGVGRGHVVPEAWIDGLDRWVLLDGQNGAWWGASGEPLGVLDLMRLYDAGERPAMNSRHHDLSDRDQADWFRYFGAAKTTGLMWAGDTFSPVFQGSWVTKTERLVHGSDHVAPDLSQIATSVIDVDGPAAAFDPVHPFATGVAVWPSGHEDDVTALDAGEGLPLRRAPGTHSLEVATTTPYGRLPPQPLRFTVR